MKEMQTDKKFYKDIQIWNKDNKLKFPKKNKLILFNYSLIKKENREIEKNNEVIYLIHQEFKSSIQKNISSIQIVICILSRRINFLKNQSTRK